MTVSELIEKLKDMPQDADVRVFAEGYCAQPTMVEVDDDGDVSIQDYEQRTA